MRMGAFWPSTGVGPRASLIVLEYSHKRSARPWRLWERAHV